MICRIDWLRGRNCICQNTSIRAFPPRKWSTAYRKTFRAPPETSQMNKPTSVRIVFLEDLPLFRLKNYFFRRKCRKRSDMKGLRYLLYLKASQPFCFTIFLQKNCVWAGHQRLWRRMSIVFFLRSCKRRYFRENNLFLCCVWTTSATVGGADWSGSRIYSLKYNMQLPYLLW